MSVAGRWGQMRRAALVLAAIVVLAASCGGGDAVSADAGEDFQVMLGSAPEFDGSVPAATT